MPKKCNLSGVREPNAVNEGDTHTKQNGSLHEKSEAKASEASLPAQGWLAEERAHEEARGLLSNTANPVSFDQ